MTLDLIPIDQIGLPIPSSTSERAWQQAQTIASGAARWNVYLNQIASQLLVEYIREDFPQLRDRIESDLWQLVNGSILELNGKRIAIVPSRSIDNSELVIPQEWIDIPAWAGDYFLAVGIDADAEMLHVWGYATHQMVKSKAAYDPSDRTYHLDTERTISDVSGLWAIQQLNPNEVTQAAIVPLASVAPAQAENLLSRLAAAANPRLEIPFSLWGALISDRQWRERLLALRQGNAPTVNRLGNWLQNAFAAGWQAVEEFLGEDAELAFALRQTAIESPSVRRVKALQLPDRVVLLLVAVTAEADARLGIQIQLRALHNTDILPAELTLELLSNEDEVMRSVVTRDRDNAIQLPRWRSESGTGFKIRVRSGETTFCEVFTV